MTDQTNAPAASSGNEGSGGRPGGGGGRRRQPPVLVEVASVAHVTPRLVSVRVTAEDLSRFAEAAPTAHIKVFLPAPGQDAPTMPIMTPEGRVWPEDQPRPIVRTYTPRAYDPESNTLEVQFLLHGVGPASEWAQNAALGDKLAIGGPGGRFNADPNIARWWIAGDESALPAVGTLLDSLAASASAEVHLEVEGPEDEIPLASAAAVTVVWHHRRGADAFGAELSDAAAAAAITEDTHVWVACEASAVRRIRSLMLTDKEVPVSRLITRGYWRIGASDHPDHDYGED
jgi:NADPH-dependent ferric siderophore reductase